MNHLRSFSSRSAIEVSFRVALHARAALVLALSEQIFAQPKKMIPTIPGCNSELSQGEIASDTPLAGADILGFLEQRGEVGAKRAGAAAAQCVEHIAQPPHIVTVSEQLRERGAWVVQQGRQDTATADRVVRMLTILQQIGRNTPDAAICCGAERDPVVVVANAVRHGRCHFQ